MSCKLPWIALLFLIASPAYAHSPKTDLLGFTPGRSFADTLASAHDQKLKCHGPGSSLASPLGMECTSASGIVTLTFAKDMPEQPLYRIAAISNPKSSQDVVVEEISAQYGVSTPDKLTNNIGVIIRYRWHLQNGFYLDFVPMDKGTPVMLILLSPELNIASWKATAVKNGEDASTVRGVPF